MQFRINLQRQAVCQEILFLVGLWIPRPGLGVPQAQRVRVFPAMPQPVVDRARGDVRVGFRVCPEVVFGVEDVHDHAAEPDEGAGGRGHSHWQVVEAGNLLQSKKEKRGNEKKRNKRRASRLWVEVASERKKTNGGNAIGKAQWAGG